MNNCTVRTDGQTARTVDLTWKFAIDAACFVVGLLMVTYRNVGRRRSSKKGYAGLVPLLSAGGDSTPNTSVSSNANAEKIPSADGDSIPTTCASINVNVSDTFPSTIPSDDSREMQRIMANVTYLLHHPRAAVKDWLDDVREVAKKKGTTFTNYFKYLVVCCCTFVILFLTSLVIGMIMDDGADSADEENHQSEEDDVLSRILMRRAGDLMTKGTLVAVLANGILFLLATVILEKWCESPEVEPDVRRTMWVHGLPVKDQRLNPFVTRPFQLTSDDLRRVGTDIAAAFNEELNKQHGVATNDKGVWVVDEWDAYLPRGTQCEFMPEYCVGNEIGSKGIYKANHLSPAIFVKKKAEASRIAQVWVTPVVDKWRSIADKLQQTIYQQQAYDEWAIRRAGWQTLYTQLSKQCQQKVHRLEAELLRLRLDKMQMCGSAFVMFKNVKDCEMLLGKPPRWWDCGKWMCFWRTLKFGKVPFTSVTLEYEPAPHPGDIIWDNMHLPRWRSELLFWFFTLMLVVVMLVIVTPLNVPQVIRGLEVLIFGRESMKNSDSSIDSNSFANHFSSLLLLLINRTLLPFPIQWIAMAGRFRRRTEEEIRQLHVNFWLLIVNTWIAPLVGVVFLQQVPGALTTGSIPCIAAQELAPKRLFVGYLIDATFLTNLYGILCGSLFDLLSWISSKVTATATLDPRKDAPPLYSFGYYYAWTLSLVMLSLCISAAVPSSLLIVAVCFSIKTIVDWVNLRQNVYETLTTQEGVFITQVVFHMRLILCMWWVSVGVGLRAFCDVHECNKEVKTWLSPVHAVLIVLACVVLLLSVFRMWHAQSLRHFIPGRLNVVESTKEDEEEMDIQMPKPSHNEHHLDWDASPAFQSLEVEAMLDEVRRKPHMSAAAFQCLKSGRPLDLGQLRPKRSATYHM